MNELKRGDHVLILRGDYKGSVGRIRNISYNKTYFVGYIDNKQNKDAAYGGHEIRLAGDYQGNDDSRSEFKVSKEVLDKVCEVLHTIIEDQYSDVEENSKLSFKDECRMYKRINSLSTGEDYEETE